MALSDKTNGQMDTLCASIPAPYGPLTRVGAMPAVSYNSAMPVQVTSAQSVTMYISYDDLNDPEIRLKIFEAFHSQGGKVNSAYLFHLLVRAMYHHFDAMDAAAWYSEAEWKKQIEMIRYFKPLFAMIPIEGFLEYDATPVVANFTSSVANLTVTFTNTSTGSPTYYLWEFGDGEISISSSTTVSRTYASAGAKSVTLIAIGPGGINAVTKSVTAVAP